MRVEIVPCLRDNYAYLLVTDAGAAVAIDPSDAAKVRARLREAGLSLVGIWLSHHHEDHVGGVAELCSEHPGLVVVGSAYDRSRGRIPRQTRGVEEGEPLWLGSQRVRVLQVPGHTLGAVAYFVSGLLFSGDTLFCAGAGRLFEGSAAMLQQSLAKLRELPDATQLYCGHEYTLQNLCFALTIEPDNAAIHERIALARERSAAGQPTVPSTLAQERASNPFLRWDEPAVIARARALGAPSDRPADVLAAIRKAKDEY